MATRNFVPRANGEGKLGTPSKKWGDVYATTIHGSLDGNASSATIATDATNDADGNPISSTYVKKDSDYLGYRQPSTAQNVGDVRYHATLPAGWFLECTTAGTTGSGTLTITSPTVGGMVSDGTVTWTIRKNASTQDLTGYLPLSGGAMTGGNEVYIARNTNTGVLSIFGGTSFADGGYFNLFGENADSNIAGGFQLVTKNAVNKLRGKTDGTLTWNGNSLDKSAVVAESLGINGYRKYASGLIEQWGVVRANTMISDSPNFYKDITLPISFTSSDAIHVCFANVMQNGASHGYLAWAYCTNTAIRVSATTNGDYSVCWRTIGY